MNKLLTGLFLFSGIILSSSALGQQESTDKKVWISIGADAAKLIDQQYQGFINLQEVIGGFAGQESIAAAHVVLLAAGVTIFLGVAGESFFK